MTNTSQKFNFAESVKKIEEINEWFQKDDIDLDLGLQKLREGNELIKRCKERLTAAENEFVKIKEEFSEENNSRNLDLKNNKLDGKIHDGNSLKEDVPSKDSPF